MKRKDITAGETYAITSDRDLYGQYVFSPAPEGLVVDVRPVMERTQYGYEPKPGESPAYDQAVARMERVVDQPSAFSEDERGKRVSAVRTAKAAAWKATCSATPLGQFRFLDSGTGVLIEFTNKVTGEKHMSVRETREVREVYSTYLARFKRVRAERAKAREEQVLQHKQDEDTVTKLRDLLSKAGIEDVFARGDYRHGYVVPMLTGAGLVALVAAACREFAYLKDGEV